MLATIRNDSTVRPSLHSDRPYAREFDFCSRRGLQLTRAQSYGWVIRAAGAEESDGAVLGCVEESGDEVELMQLCGGFRWSIHRSLHDALLQLVEDLPEIEQRTRATSDSAFGDGDPRHE